MTTITTITETQATAALEAVKAQYAPHLAPQTVDGETYDALYPEPTLVWEYTDSGHPAICWEEGPSDWAMLLDGGTSEEDRYLYASLAEEFGSDVKAPERPAAKMPAGVYAEPIMSFVLGLYPA